MSKPVFMRTTKTDDVGTYIIQYLPVGGYTVTVEAPGFKKFVQQNMVITVDQTQALNIVLAVGAESQTVEITTAPAAGEHEQCGTWPDCLSRRDQ